VLNIGTGSEVSVNELARVMGERSGSTNVPLHVAARPGELQRSSLDPERAGIHLGWRAWTELEAGVDGVLEYTRRRAGT
jgi:UDP-glucose 4-epimerase